MRPAPSRRRDGGPRNGAAERIIVTPALRERPVAVSYTHLDAYKRQELRYRVLWKRFYKTIAIAARENPRCRMTHCPKRYWENMLEMEDELRRTPDSLDAVSYTHLDVYKRQ